MNRAHVEQYCYGFQRLEDKFFTVWPTVWFRDFFNWCYEDADIGYRL